MLCASMHNQFSVNYAWFDSNFTLFGSFLRRYTYRLIFVRPMIQLFFLFLNRKRATSRLHHTTDSVESILSHAWIAFDIKRLILETNRIESNDFFWFYLSVFHSTHVRFIRRLIWNGIHIFVMTHYARFLVEKPFDWPQTSNISAQYFTNHSITWAPNQEKIQQQKHTLIVTT